MNTIQLIRLPVALVWLYQGLWCKLLGGMPHYQAIVGSVPFFGPAAANTVLFALGLLESALAVWILTGWRARWAALAQTLLLAGMNAGGLIWGRAEIADPAGMIFQNIAFLTLAWIAAGEVRLVSAKG